VVTHPENIYHDSVRDLVPRKVDYEWGYWRRVLRMAALCHDIGHLPFSHAAEKDLLPAGTRHEHLSRNHILGDELRPIFAELKIQPEDVAKLAVGPKYYGKELSVWESILYEMIGGDVFGADRIDYLLRDSFHSGVAYGRFDHTRLIETMRILPREDRESDEPELGITVGGFTDGRISPLGALLHVHATLFSSGSPNLRYSSEGVPPKVASIGALFDRSRCTRGHNG
jgi:uncharacterized protein